MVVTLNITWNSETLICSDILSPPGKADVKMFITWSLKIQIIAENITVPMRLKVKCISATRFELALAPTDAKSDLAKKYDDDANTILDDLWDNFKKDMEGYEEARKFIERQNTL